MKLLDKEELFFILKSEMRARKLILPILIVFNFFISPCTGDETRFQAQVSDRIDSLISLPEFSSVNFGIAIYSLDDKKMLYEKNSQRLFVDRKSTRLNSSHQLISYA